MKNLAKVFMAALALFAVCAFVSCANSSNPFAGNTYELTAGGATTSYAFDKKTVNFTVSSVSVEYDYTYTDTKLTLSKDGTALLEYEYKFDDDSNLVLTLNGVELTYTLKK